MVAACPYFFIELIEKGIIAMPATLELETMVQHHWPGQMRGPVEVAPQGGGLGPPVVWRVTSGEGTYALRQWRVDQRAHAERVASLLRHVDQRRRQWVAVPYPSAAGGMFGEAGGALWELAPWLPGEADFALAPSPERVASAATALAELHLALGDIPCEGPRLGPATGQAAGQLEQVRQLLDSGRLAEATPTMQRWGWPEQFPTVDRALRAGYDIAWGSLLPLRDERLPCQWCWGDAWHRNMLFDGDRVTGLIDFVTARVDVAVADLARLIGSMCVDNPVWRRVAIESYTALRPLRDVELQASAAIKGVATVVSLANWCRWLAVEHQAVAHPQEVCDRVEHFVGRLRVLLDR